MFHTKCDYKCLLSLHFIITINKLKWLMFQGGSIGLSGSGDKGGGLVRQQRYPSYFYLRSNEIIVITNNLSVFV